MPAFEDQPSAGRQAESENNNVREGALISPTPDRAGPSAMAGHEDAAPRPDFGPSDRREEVVTISSASPLQGGLDGEPAGYPNPDRSRDLIEGPAIGPVSPGAGDWADGGESLGGRIVEGARHSLADFPMAGVAAAAVARSIESPPDLERLRSRSDRSPGESATRGSASVSGAAPETVAVGLVGPASRHDDSFDRASGEPASATNWGGSSCDDPFGGRHGTASAADEGPAGVDLSATNALLGQILDELRRHQQSAPIASGRSVYPER
jgi:hypothetical protein